MSVSEKQLARIKKMEDDFNLVSYLSLRLNLNLLSLSQNNYIHG